MKKVWAIVLAVMTVCLLVGCGGTAAGMRQEDFWVYTGDTVTEKLEEAPRGGICLEEGETTARGIGLGDSGAEVFRAYGNEKCSIVLKNSDGEYEGGDEIILSEMLDEYESSSNETTWIVIPDDMADGCIELDIKNDAVIGVCFSTKENRDIEEGLSVGYSMMNYANTEVLMQMPWIEPWIAELSEEEIELILRVGSPLTLDTPAYADALTDKEWECAKNIAIKYKEAEDNIR